MALWRWKAEVAQQTKDSIFRNFVVLSGSLHFLLLVAENVQAERQQQRQCGQKVGSGHEGIWGLKQELEESWVDKVCCTG